MCGNCVLQKTDEECFCCQEHPLLVEELGRKQLPCICDKPGLDAYIVHKPALEMAFIDSMIRRQVKGPAPEGELSNRYLASLQLYI